MGIRSVRFTLLFPLLFFFCYALYGQEVSWFLDQSGGVPRFIQRLSWTSDEYTLRYVVVIEREEAGVFREILRESTEANYIEVSLAPGKYRYGITAYDLLNRRGSAPEWVPFEVIVALEPELRDFSPDQFYLDEGKKLVLNLTGRNLLPGAEVYLRQVGSTERVIVPVEYTSSASLSGAQLVFNLNQLMPGNYEVYIKNPGGFETSLGTFKITLGRPVDFHFALDYAPLFPLYGELNQLFDQPVFPLGGQIRFGVIPLKRGFGYIGLELVVGWQYFHSAFDDYEVSFHAPAAELNILFQKWFPNRVMAVTFRAGGGMGMAMDYHITYSRGDDSETVSFLSPRAIAGISFLYLITRSFFAEAGVDYMHWWTADDPSPGYLRPRLGAGYRF